MKHYPKLFTPGKIAHLSIKNRIVMTAMGTCLAGVDGQPSPEIIKYYEARAKGGVGLIITEITRIDEAEGKGISHQLGATEMKHIAAIQQLTDTIHSHGTKIFLQLQHPGKEGIAQLTNGPLVAPSVIPGSKGNMPRELSTEEVQGLVKKFITGAVIARAGGADGVEVHAAHGYLVNQFLSPRHNHRTDQYGGSFENRLRFAVEIVSGIRQACPGFPISVRISADEFMPDGNNLEAGVKIAQAMVAAGADVINVSNGLHESGVTIMEPYAYPEGWKKHLAIAVKAAVNVPVIAVNTIKTPDFAESLLEEGVSDFVGVGRSLLADPEWPNKAKQGKPETIRNCIGCMQCFSELGAGRHIGCAANPRTGRELYFGAPAADAAGRKAVVIGGGPAGMEAASTLARRGFQVTLFEQANQLGGALNLADKPPKKHLVTRLKNVMAGELESLGVDVKLNTKATPEMVKALEPDAVFLAFGASPIVPPIPYNGPVYTFADILTGKVAPEGRAAVIGGGLVGLETAEFLAEKGHPVTVVEMRDAVGIGVYASVVFTLKKGLAEHGASILTGHRLTAVTAEGIEAQAGGESVKIPCDFTVLALGSKPNGDVLEQFLSEFPEAVIIGDAVSGRRMMEATAEGYLRALHI